MMIFFFVSVYFSRFLLLRNLTGVFLLRRSDYKNIGKRGRANNSFDLIKADRIRITCQLTGGEKGMAL